MSDDEEHLGSVTPTRETGYPYSHIPSPDVQTRHLRTMLEPENRFFVGSPDQYEGHATTSNPTSNHSDQLISAPSSRPILLSRSVSSPLVPKRRMSSSHRLLSGSQAGTPDSNQRWTLFGQLMENEGQLPISPGGRRRTGFSNRQDSLEIPGLHPMDSDPFDTRSVAEDDGHSAARLSSAAPSFRGSPTATNDDDPDYSESDTESVSSLDEELAQPISLEQAGIPWYSFQRIPSVPILYRNVLKCAMAYFIASLFTFNPFFANILSKVTTYGGGPNGPGPREPFPSGHMVATMLTMGGMIEADIFCLVGLLFAAFVCLCSMNMFWWLELSPGWEWLGDLVAILWIGIITTIVICGSLVSNLVCYLIWPQSAIDGLQTNMTKTLDSFSTVLSMLTNTFLLEGGVHNKAHLDKMQRAVENHQSSFTSLKKSLFEARTEWFLRGEPAGALPDDTGKRAYEDAVDSLNRLGQHLNGLRSGTRLQYDLTKAGVVKSRRRKNKRNHNNRPVEIDLSASEVEETAMLKAAAIMFGDLVDDLGPPLKALSDACTNSLKRLREAFEQSKSHRRMKGLLFKQDEFLRLVDDIERALVRKGDPPDSRPRSVAGSVRTSSVYSSRGEDLDHALLVGSDNEQVFLVYFFIFTLQEYAREVVSLIDAMARIYHYEQDYISRGHWWKRAYQYVRSRFSHSSNIPRRKNATNKRSFSSYIIPDIRHPLPSFPKVQPHAPNTMQMPSRDELGAIGRVKQALWKLGNRLTQRDTKYAFKVGMAIAIFAAPAFYDTTRPSFVKYWGDWALISVNLFET
ncbi:hypothetical protein H0H87_009751 [Tephrocybe sp. NHM501043]|nr:hypothetical protein H0H87_009751 [Tephrocybe sp. NHM501043]